MYICRNKKQIEIMKKTKITKTENLCLKCDGGIIERFFEETEENFKITIKKCTNKSVLTN